MLVGAIDSFSLRSTADSNLNNKAAIWLHAEAKPAIQLRLPVSIHASSLLTHTQMS